MDSYPNNSDWDPVENYYPSIPTHSSAHPTLRCCCGRDDCALLEHNNVALEGLEKDLETAAKLGQVRYIIFGAISAIFSFKISGVRGLAE